MICPVRDLPGPLLVGVAQVIDISGIRFRYWICLTSPAMEDSAHLVREYPSWRPRCRGVGRPSVVAQYPPRVSAWLRERGARYGVEFMRDSRCGGASGVSGAV